MTDGERGKVSLPEQLPEIRASLNKRTQKKKKRKDKTRKWKIVLEKTVETKKFTKNKLQLSYREL